MTNLQRNLFEGEKSKESSRSYLEMLAGTCGHIASFGVGEFEYDPLKNFWKGRLHIRVINDGNNSQGIVNWQGNEVFSYRSGEEEIWGENNWETEIYFSVGMYIPGAWERLIDELYEESIDGNLTSD